jgi:hypothetical protein
MNEELFLGVDADGEGRLALRSVEWVVCVVRSVWCEVGSVWCEVGSVWCEVGSVCSE